MVADDRVDRARLAYERAVFGGDTSTLDLAERELDEVEADLSLARGRLLHARFLDQRLENPQELELFEHAARLYHELGGEQGEGEALFWVGCFHQVVRRDNDAAVPALKRSAELARRAGDDLTLSYALRHLGYAEHVEGRNDGARQRLEESLRLRREVGFLPGVAANLVGLAYLSAEDGNRAEADRLLDEADAIAEASGAHGITRMVAEARTQL